MQGYDCVGVLGGGSWGTTLSHLLGRNGHQVLFWLRDRKSMDEINIDRRNRKYTQDTALSENIQATTDLEEVAKRCEVFIIAIPSQSFREVVYQLGNMIKGDQILISGCKGLEEGSYSRMTTILKEETCAKKIGVFSGPNLAQEILQGHPSAAVIGSSYHEVIKKMIALFSCDTFRLYGNEDVAGVELGGVIKNVIAIAAGVADGLEYGINTKALLMTRGIGEMGHIGKKLGAKPITFTGLAGIGDMIVTCTSNLSRNYRIGYYLAQGKTLAQIMEHTPMVAEGVITAKVLSDFAQKNQINAPITNGICQILHQNRPIKQVVNELMARFALFEIDSNLFS